MLRKQRLVRGVAGVVGLAVLPLVAGCGGGGGEAETGGKSSKSSSDVSNAAVVAPAKVEVIASLTGCEAEIRVEAEQLREGVCRTKQGDYLITTFPEEKYKLTWLDSASVYGGKYLVGPRWAISAEPKLLGPLRKKVGGTIEDLGTTRGTAPNAP